MRRAYKAWAPRGEALAMVQKVNEICAAYRAQGYDLTLRQLYYQFVSRDLLANNQKSYNLLGRVVDRGRLAGLIDWSYIVDRTRNLRGTSHWDDPESVIQAAANSYRIDKWADQPARVEVWVEKEALAGIIQRAADLHDVDWFSCRGYVSQSEMWAAGRRHLEYLKAGQRVVVLHLGDHDPSGIDMTRDIRERLQTFAYTDWHHDHIRDLGTSSTWGAIQQHMADSGIPLEDAGPIEVRRIALNMDQVEEYQPPPNPAKLTDSRAEEYIEQYGDESWELDALNPDVLADLIATHIEEIRDDAAYDLLAERETNERDSLEQIAESYEQIVETFG